MTKEKKVELTVQCASMAIVAGRWSPSANDTRRDPAFMALEVDGRRRHLCSRRHVQVVEVDFFVFCIFRPLGLRDRLSWERTGVELWPNFHWFVGS